MHSLQRSAALRDAQRDRLELEPADEALGPFARESRDDAPVPVSGTGPVCVALDELPALELTGVVFANELLDNLPFGIAEANAAGWREVRVGLGADGELVELLVPAEPDDCAALDALTGDLVVPPGARLPIPRGLDAWLGACGRMLRHGTLIVIDYVADVAELLGRGTGAGGWLRTYHAHRAGGSPLDEPGARDVTADVAREQLLRAARRAGFTALTDVSQAEWLSQLGIDELVEAGRRTWHERAHVGDLDALAGRSRVAEARALTEQPGLGAHRVLTFSR